MFISKILISVLFMVMGVFMGGELLITSISANGGLADFLLAVLILSAFAGSGAVLLIQTINELKTKKRIDADGTEYFGQIVDYWDGREKINNIPTLGLTILYYDNVSVQMLYVETHQCKEYPYPLNSYCRVKVIKDGESSFGNIIKDSVGCMCPDYIQKAFDAHIEQTAGLYH